METQTEQEINKLWYEWKQNNKRMNGEFKHIQDYNKLGLRQKEIILKIKNLRLKE